MSAPAEQLHVCIPEYALGYAYCEDMAQLPNSNSRQKVRAGSDCMCAYRIMSWVYILRGHGATFKFKLKAKRSRGYAKHAESIT